VQGRGAVRKTGGGDCLILVRTGETPNERKPGEQTKVTQGRQLLIFVGMLRFFMRKWLDKNINNSKSIHT